MTGAAAVPRRRAVMIAAASAARTTHITDGSSTTRTDGDQLAATLLTVRKPKTANAATPIPSQAARPARLESQRLYSGAPACSGTPVSAGSVLPAYPAATIMPSSSTPPLASAAINDTPRELPYRPR